MPVSPAKAPILISSRIFIPNKGFDQELLDQYYSVPLYTQTKCNRCEIFKEGARHSPTCDACPAFKGIMQLWRKKKYNGVNYIAVPPARPKQVEKIFNVDMSTAQDLRPIIPFDSDLKFTGKLYTGKVIDDRRTVNQEQIVKDWLRRQGGIIEVPPRGGKTAIAAKIICEMGVKAVVVCSLRSLLKQFRRTFRGNRKYPAFTNAKQIERQTGRPVVGLVEKMSDFEGLDVALVNYQKFIRNEQSIARIREYINNHYSLIFVDECHDAGALRYAQFISRLNCRYRGGLSATVDRKDGLSTIVKQYLGGVAARSDVTALIPNIELVETGVTSHYDYKSWVYAMKFLAGSKPRLKLIVREVFKDLRAGHTGIIIPVDFVAHAKALVEAINNQAEINRNKRQEKWPKETAALYSAVLKTKELQDRVLRRMDNGQHKVLVAIRKMIRVGIDLSLPTMAYIVVPMSADAEVGAPMFYQLSHRVSTWAPNKKQPVVKIFIDGIPQSSGCFKSLFWKEVLPGLRSKDKSARYKMETPEFKRAIMIAKEYSYKPPNQPGERVSSTELINGDKPTVNKVIGIQRGLGKIRLASGR
jgi:hypothetical protein